MLMEDMVPKHVRGRLTACGAAGLVSVLYKRFKEFLPFPPWKKQLPALERAAERFLEDFDPSEGGSCWPLRQRGLG